MYLFNIAFNNIEKMSFNFLVYADPSVLNNSLLLPDPKWFQVNRVIISQARINKAIRSNPYSVASKTEVV